MSARLLLLAALWLASDASDVDVAALGEVIVNGAERPLTAADHLALLRTSSDIVRFASLATAQPEECVLRRFVKRTPVQRCELLQRKICKPENVLLRKMVVEDCSVTSEFCEASRRTQRLDSSTLLCQNFFGVSCQSEQCQDCQQICVPKNTLICRSIPQIVTLTERKQKCNGEQDYRTTKLCTTMPDGTGDCKNLTSRFDVCDETDEMKLVNSELGPPKLDCVDAAEQVADFCYASNCQLTRNETVCVSGKLPEAVELKETVCEKCVDGRRKVRPVIEQREVCRDKAERFCLDLVEKEERWRKWCRPLSAKPNANARPAQETSEAVYRIEISPGYWVSTSNETEAREYLAQQQSIETYYSNLTDEQRTELENSIAKDMATEPEEISKASNEESDRQSFSERIYRCTRDPNNCQYRF